MSIVLADNQDLTRLGLVYTLQKMGHTDDVFVVTDKIELAYRLKEDPESVLVLDYTLFDFNDVSEIIILSQRFKSVKFVFFSEDLSTDFVRQAITSIPKSSILLKDSPLPAVDGIGGAPVHHRCHPRPALHLPACRWNVHLQ